MLAKDTLPQLQKVQTTTNTRPLYTEYMGGGGGEEEVEAEEGSEKKLLTQQYSHAPRNGFSVNDVSLTRWSQKNIIHYNTIVL